MPSLHRMNNRFASPKPLSSHRQRMPPRGFGSDPVDRPDCALCGEAVIRRRRRHEPLAVKWPAMRPFRQTGFVAHECAVEPVGQHWSGDAPRAAFAELHEEASVLAGYTADRAGDAGRAEGGSEANPEQCLLLCVVPARDRKRRPPASSTVRRCARIVRPRSVSCARLRSRQLFATPQFASSCRRARERAGRVTLSISPACMKFGVRQNPKK